MNIGLSSNVSNSNIVLTSNKQHGQKKAFEFNLDTRDFYSWFKGGMYKGADGWSRREKVDLFLCQLSMGKQHR